METININSFLFTRTAPKKKLEVIKKLTASDLAKVSEDTLKRVVREAGTATKPKGHNKDLSISRKNMVGNDWNSDFDAICLYKGKLFIDLYIQMDHTDTTICGIPYKDFFRKGEYRGKAYEVNRYGDEIPFYAVYDDNDKTECMRSILIQYVCSKYADKLK